MGEQLVGAHGATESTAKCFAILQLRIPRSPVIPDELFNNFRLRHGQ